MVKTIIDIKSLKGLNTKQLEQLRVLADTTRLQLFTSFHEPKTVTEVAKILGVERSSLYHHIQILLKNDLLEQVEVRHIKNFNESVYLAAEMHLDFTRHEIEEPGPKESYQQLIMGIAEDTSEECIRSLVRGGDLKAAATRHIISIGKDSLSSTPRRISELMREFIEKVKELEEEGGDIDYSISVVHFEM